MKFAVKLGPEAAGYGAVEKRVVRASKKKWE